jgi:hypothetical protein
MSYIIPRSSRGRCSNRKTIHNKRRRPARRKRRDSRPPNCRSLVIAVTRAIAVARAVAIPRAVRNGGPEIVTRSVPATASTPAVSPPAAAVIASTCEGLSSAKGHSNQSDCEKQIMILRTITPTPYCLPSFTIAKAPSEPALLKGRVDGDHRRAGTRLTRAGRLNGESIATGISSRRCVYKGGRI